MLHPAACSLQRGGNDVAPVGDGGSAEDEHEIAVRREFGESGRQGRGLVRHPPLCGDDSAGGSEAVRRHAQRLVDHLVGEARQQRRYHRDPPPHERRDAHQWRRRRQPSDTPVARRGIGNDLDGRHHFAGLDGRKGRQRRQGDRLVEAVDAVDAVARHHQHPCLGGEDVGAAGEGRIDPDALTRHGGGDARSRLVLADIARLGLGHSDAGDARRLQGRDLGDPDPRALLEDEAALSHGMGDDAAERLIHRHGTEPHRCLPSASPCAAHAMP